MTIHPSRIEAKAKDLKLVPTHLRLSLKMWVDFAANPGRGSFLLAVLQNDLRGAVLRADPENTTGVVGLVRFLHEFCPALCWGSPERVANWPEELRRLDALREAPREGAA